MLCYVNLIVLMDQYECHKRHHYTMKIYFCLIILTNFLLFISWNNKLQNQLKNSIELNIFIHQIYVRKKFEQITFGLFY